MSVCKQRRVNADDKVGKKDEGGERGWGAYYYTVDDIGINPLSHINNPVSKNSPFIPIGQGYFYPKIEVLNWANPTWLTVFNTQT